jgi:hypothetical protein
MDLLDFDPISGESVSFQWNDEAGTFTVGHHQDVSPVLEANKRRVIESDAHQEIKAGWLKYASVPNVLIMKWKNELGVDFFDENHWPAVMRLINSPEYRFLKATAATHDR